MRTETNVIAGRASGSRRASGYRPELDGVRAIAILSVMILHSELWVSWRLDGLARGVDLFFVLSGFLITSLLIDEHDVAGGIGKRRFYGRRALRILPVLGATLLLCAIIAPHMGARTVAAYPRSALIVLGFGTNWFVPKVEMLLGHTWSLALEEQYYLVWPLVLGLLLRARVRRERAALGMLLVAGGVAGVRAVYYHLLHGTGAWTGGPTERAGLHAMYAWSRADGVIIGSALALLMCSSYGSVVKKLLRDRSLACAALIGSAAIYAQSALKNPTSYDSIFVLDILFAIVIGHVVADAASPVARSLRFPLLRGIGKISYGLYLYHLPLVFLVNGRYSGARAAAIAWGGSFTLAISSYYVLEKPILRLKRLLAAAPAARTLQPTSTMSVVIPARRPVEVVAPSRLSISRPAQS
jgi:peptidoglycan/LPS O-acetylase OafA/YrhL